MDSENSEIVCVSPNEKERFSPKFVKRDINPVSIEQKLNTKHVRKGQLNPLKIRPKPKNIYPTPTAIDTEKEISAGVIANINQSKSVQETHKSNDKEEEKVTERPIFMTTNTPEKVQGNMGVCDLCSNSKENMSRICDQCLHIYRKKCKTKMLKWIGGIIILILIIVIIILTYLYITVKLKYEELDTDYNDLEDKYASAIHNLKHYKGPWKDTSNLDNSKCTQETNKIANLQNTLKDYEEHLHNFKLNRLFWANQLIVLYKNYIAKEPSLLHRELIYYKKTIAIHKSSIHLILENQKYIQNTQMSNKLSYQTNIKTLKNHYVLFEQNSEYYNWKINYLQKNCQLKTAFLLNMLNNKDDQLIKLLQTNAYLGSQIGELHVDLKNKKIDNFRAIREESYLLKMNKYIRYNHDLLPDKNEVNLNKMIRESYADKFLEIKDIYLKAAKNFKNEIKLIKSSGEYFYQMREYFYNSYKHYLYKSSSLTEFCTVTENEGIYYQKYNSNTKTFSRENVTGLTKHGKGEMNINGIYIVGGYSNYNIRIYDMNTLRENTPTVKLLKTTSPSNIVYQCFLQNYKNGFCTNPAGYVHKYNLETLQESMFFYKYESPFTTGIESSSGNIIVMSPGKIYILNSGGVLINIHEYDGLPAVNNIAEIASGIFISADENYGCFLHNLFDPYNIPDSSRFIYETDIFYASIVSLHSSQGDFAIGGKALNKGFIQIHHYDNLLGTKKYADLGENGCIITVIKEIKTGVLVYGGNEYCQICIWKYSFFLDHPLTHDPYCFDPPVADNISDFVALPI